MGIIQIYIGGSFDYMCEKEFSAMDHGHAATVSEAIKFLASEVMPSAIAQDHKLQAKGHLPRDGFGQKGVTT